MAYSHSCKDLLCESPHECCDHNEECGCDHCHYDHRPEHSWRDWNCYPLCMYCEEEMFDEIGPLLEDYHGKNIEAGR